MDPSSHHDDIVQDSEDEGLMGLELDLNPMSSGHTSAHQSSDRVATSSIQTTSTTRLPVAALPVVPTGVSSSTFNTNTAVSSIYSGSTIPKSSTSSRPRPRPAYKGANAQATIVGTTVASTSTATPSSEIQTSSSASNVPRNLPSSIPLATTDTIVESFSIYDKAKSDITPNDNIELYTQDMNIAERAKLRSRSRTTKSQAQQRAYSPTDDVINIPSSDSEMNLRPPVRKSKARPKPLAPQKPSPSTMNRTKTSHMQAEESDPIMLSVPVAETSIDLSSSLPPSSLPPPSSINGLSSISIDADNVLDGAISPLSSSPLPAPRKRKRKMLTFDEEDGVDSRASERSGAGDTFIEATGPAPFFAGSSPDAPTSDTLVGSSSMASNVNGKVKGATKAQGKEGGVRDVDDEEGEKEPAPKSKPKGKQRKKKGDDDDEEWGADDAPKASRRGRKKGNSDDEEDWSAKPKKKAPPRKKATSKKDVAAQQVSVVIDRPKTGRGAKAKGGTKGPKPPTSKEFVEDSEGENDRILMPPPDAIPSHSATTPVPSSLAFEDDELLLVPQLDKPGATTSSKRKDSSSTSAPSGEPPNPFENDQGEADGEPSLPSSKSRGKKRAVFDSDEEEELVSKSGSPPKKARTARRPRKSAPAALGLQDEGDADEGDQGSKTKENANHPLAESQPAPLTTPKTPLPASASRISNSNRAYSISSKKSTPMSELIRKVNSLPGSPFASPRPTYSPYTKSSKNLLKRIAPLHPNRRTPPPPPPRLPPPKKSKKQLELEEKWEMELEETVDGWYCLPEEERAALRKAKRNAEMGFED
ncbi:hypothetical protein IEO21_05553 [Rhodonia placenta]|uniref:Uncharacterized protein n=1 Tax=Rhodonia placenta TaxID=104341 RepID=A0A8H7P269_9APHY|nr:hypothetical protein IEO21_05553 [Postia placenta]